MPPLSTILIADDELGTREVLGMMFATEAYRLVYAENGEEALKLAAQIYPDVILLDVMMPRLDGLEVCRRLRADPRLGGLPILLVTALTDSATRLAGLDAGADDFITKPFDQIELKTRVRAILRFNHYRQILEEQARLEAERQQAEAAMRENAAILHSVLNAMPESVLLIDPTGIVQFVNETAAQRLGTTADCLTRNNIYDFLPPSNARHRRAQMEEARRTGKTVRFEDQRAGLHFAHTIYPLLDAQTQVAQFAILSVDLTPHKQAEARLLEALHQRQVSQAELETQNDELRRIQADLETARARYFDLYDMAPVGYVTLDDHGSILEANLTAAEYLNVTRSVMIHMPMTRFVYSADQDLFCRLRQQLREAGSRQVDELRMRRAEADPIWVQLAMTGTRTADGTPVCRVAISDITARKQAEEALRQSETKYHMLFAEMMNGFAVHEILYDRTGQAADYITLEVNRAYEALLNTRREDVVGKKAGEILSQTELEKWLGVFGPVALTGEPTHYEMYSPRTQKHFEGIAFRSEKDRFAVSFMDVTERWQAEAALRESERFSRSTLDALDEHIAILDETGTILQANRAWRRFANENGLALSDAGVGANYLAVCHAAQGPGAEAAADFAQGIRAVMRGERDSYELEYDCHSPQERRWFVGRATRFQEPGPVRIVVAHNNITPRVLAEEAQRESEVRFRQVVHSVTEHIYVSEIRGEEGVVNVYQSARVEQLTGYPHQKFMDTWTFWLEAAVYPGDREVAQAHVARLRACQSSMSEYRLLRPDGNVIWVRDSARVETTAAGVKTIYGVVTDITARKQTEAALRELSTMLEQRVVDRTRELSTLYAVATVTSQHLPLNAMLQQSLAAVLKALEGHAGAVQLLDEADRCLRLSAHTGIPEAALADLSQIPLGQGLDNWVVEHDRPLVVPNVSLDPRHISARQTGDWWESRNYLGVPMHVQGRCIGVLSVRRPAGHAFTSEAVALLSTIADQMAVAVESALLRQQAEQAIVTEERQRLARELHDSLTQALYSLTLLAETGHRQVAAGDQGQALEQLATIRETAQQALKEMRLLVYALRPTVLESEGLVSALRQRLEAVEQRAGMETRLLVEGADALQAFGQQSPRREEALYRIALEALNNAYRHAAAAQINMRLSMHEQQIEMDITDNGQGFDPGALENRGGQGLTSMRERAEKLGGTFNLFSTPGQGTTVQVKFDYKPEGEATQEAL